MLTTFIIPTIGRDTLKFSVDSILKQSDPDWKCIIINDGIEPNYYNNDERIKIIKIDRKGTAGQYFRNAGLVRNEGFDLVDTEFISLLDDDDIIHEDYVKELKNYTNYDLIIFKMLVNNEVIPRDENIKEGNVGISFSFNKKVLEKNKFINSNIEDYEFVKSTIESGFSYCIINKVMYYVRPNR